MKKKTIGWMLWMGISLVILGAFLWPAAGEEQIQQKIAEEILRFHVLANSDAACDQEEKMRVKQAVVEYLNPLLASAQSKEESKQRIRQEMSSIGDLASSFVSSGHVEVLLEESWFPEISYGDCTFPEGKYEALCIKIGEAKGHNWWCVLYPGLCFSNAVKPVVTEDGKQQLKNVLDEDCYDFLLHPAKTKIRFRLFSLEFFRGNR